MREKLLEVIRQHVIAEYPKEACGVIIQKGNKQTYMPCHNDADDPLNNFVTVSYTHLTLPTKRIV